mmetsp:Transcript_35644/g.102429  ORF Transcript_35644/g.102429 Transcript_35644/m.102429 type:complete len:269 (-) Transcript_35644:301-1107(-)
MLWRELLYGLLRIDAAVLQPLQLGYGVQALLDVADGVLAYAADERRHLHRHRVKRPGHHVAEDLDLLDNPNEQPSAIRFGLDVAHPHIFPNDALPLLEGEVGDDGRDEVRVGQHAVAQLARPVWVTREQHRLQKPECLLEDIHPSEVAGGADDQQHERDDELRVQHAAVGRRVRVEDEVHAHECVHHQPLWQEHQLHRPAALLTVVQTLHGDDPLRQLVFVESRQVSLLLVHQPLQQAVVLGRAGGDGRVGRAEQPEGVRWGAGMGPW